MNGRIWPGTGNRSGFHRRDSLFSSSGLVLPTIPTTYRQPLGSNTMRKSMRNSMWNPTRITSILACCAFAWILPPGLLSAQTSVSFSHDVQPVLTKLGCNQGACHGAQHGKGGFKLSLRGFDDRADYFEIVKSLRGRRVLPHDPTLSLLVAKPALEVPHKGGKRLDKDSWEYETLVRWIEQGAPASPNQGRKLVGLTVEPAESVLKAGDTQALKVLARYDDGFTEELREKAGFDSTLPTVAEVSPLGKLTVRGKGETVIMVRFLDRVAVSRVLVPFGLAPTGVPFARHNFVDEQWIGKIHELGLAPATTCTDTEFLRRIHLDTLGTLPSAEDIRAFVANTDPQKRARAIDVVLDRPEYVDYWAYKWGDLLRCSRDQLGEKGMWAFHNWLRGCFRENKPMDQFVGEMITAVGSPFQNGPANFYKVGGNAENWAENAAQVFLGVRVQCARCHHHPFENISQADFAGLAAFFTRVGTKRSQEFGLFGADTVIFVRDRGEARHPRTGIAVPPTPLGGAPIDDPQDRRRALARWLADRENLVLARNLVNRYWGYLMGRGLVHPIDDLRVTNPPSCPELYEALAKDLVAHDYDIKHLLRQIMNSHVYQLSATPHPTSVVDADNKYFTRYAPKRLSAEQLFDAIDSACGTREKFAQLPMGYRAIALPDANVASRFLDIFGRPKREISCECERSDTPNMSQALQLLTGSMVHRKVQDPNGRIARLLKEKAASEKIVDELYMHTLSRLPTQEERGVALVLVKQAPTPKEGFEDLLWALLNTGEFLFNH